MNRLSDKFDFLKNKILHTKKGKRINPKPKSQKGFSSLLPKVKQAWLRNDRPKCNVIFIALTVRASSEWYFNSGCPRQMKGGKSFFRLFSRN